MIRLGTGNMLQADVDALVNTVNTVGVMGKGLALQFRRAFPDMHEAYQRAAEAGELELGRMHVWPTKALAGPRFIINFPTKRHWRSRSRLESIDAGLVDLIRVVKELDINSIAVPPLGCGNGGLDWRDVEPRIRRAFEQVPEVDVLLFPPGATPPAAAMRTGTRRPDMTAGRAALLAMLDRYIDRALQASLIETHKLLYFLQVAGEPLRLRYVQGLYGPYADNLRHVLNLLEGHFLSGFGDGSLPVQEAEPIRVLPDTEGRTTVTLKAHPETVVRIDRVLELVEGFESAYGLELLASVHWMATRSGDAVADHRTTTKLVQSWTPRKARIFTEHHIETAWNALNDRGWLTSV